MSFTNSVIAKMPAVKQLTFVFLIFFGLCSFAFSNVDYEKKDSPRVSVVEMTKDILYYVNLHRRSIGLQNLQLNDVECALAVQHSINMASNKTPFGHSGLNDRAKKIAHEIGKISMVAENVASGDMSAKEVVDGWLHSPGHKRNIETNFTLTGIGVAKNSKGIIYYTQIFTK